LDLISEIYVIMTMIPKAISSGKPGDISNAVVDKIAGNEGLQSAIQQLMEIKTCEFLLEPEKEINAIDNIEVSVIMK
jgi:hypothetical protein